MRTHFVPNLAHAGTGLLVGNWNFAGCCRRSEKNADRARRESRPEKRHLRGLALSQMRKRRGRLPSSESEGKMKEKLASS